MKVTETGKLRPTGKPVSTAKEWESVYEFHAHNTVYLRHKIRYDWHETYNVTYTLQHAVELTDRESIVLVDT